MAKKYLLNSENYQAILAKARKDNRDVKAIKSILWQINAHPDLRALAQVMRGLHRILCLMEDYLSEQLSKFEPDSKSTPVPGYKAWKELSEYLYKSAIELSKNEGFTTLSVEATGNINPIYNHGITRNAMYALLADSLTDEEYQEKYDALIGHLLMVHIRTMRSCYPQLVHECYHGSEESFLLPDSIYYQISALREMTSNSVTWGLDLIDAKCSVGDFFSRSKVASAEIKGRIHRAVGAERTSDETKHLKSLRRLLVFMRIRYRRKINASSRRRKTTGWFSERKKSMNISPMHGYTEPLNKDLFITYYLGDDYDELQKEEASWLSISSYSKPDSTASKKLLKEDLNPEEECEDQGDLFMEVTPCRVAQVSGMARALAAKGRVKHTAMANQMLPWAFDALTQTELLEFLGGCRQHFENIIHKTALEISLSDKLDCFAIGLIHTILWTGSTIDRALQLEHLYPDEQSGEFLVSPPEPANSSEETHTEKWSGSLGFWVGPNNPTSKDGSWVVEAMTPEYRTEADNPPLEKMRCCDRYLHLPDIMGTTNLLITLEKVFKEERTVFFSAYPESEYRQAISNIIATVCPKRRIKLSNLQNFLYKRVISETRDVTLASEITARPLQQASTRLFYTTPSQEDLRSIYVSSLTDLANDCRTSVGDDKRERDKEFHHTLSGYVGARYCPTNVAVREGVLALKDQLEKLDSFDNLVEYHNHLTLYTLLMWNYGTSSRAIISPFGDLHEFSDASPHFIFLADKQGVEKNTARVIPLPEAVCQQLQFYNEHCRVMVPWIREHYRRVPGKLFQTGFWIGERPEKIRPNSYSTTQLKYIPFPANVHRRFMRMSLLDKSTPIEMIDAWMGHASRGEDPWEKYSSFQFNRYLKTMDKRVMEILKSVDLDTPIKSKVVGQ